MAMTLPPMTADELRMSILKMVETTVEMLRVTREALLQPSPTALARVTVHENALQQKERWLTDRVAVQLQDSPWTLGAAERLAMLPAGLEGIGVAAEHLAGCVEAIRQEGVPFSEPAFMEILRLFDAGIALVTAVAAALRTPDRMMPSQLQASCAAFRTKCDAAALEHEDRLLRGTCVPRASGIFLTMLDHFGEIEHAVRRIAADLGRALATQ